MFFCGLRPKLPESIPPQQAVTCGIARVAKSRHVTQYLQNKQYFNWLVVSTQSEKYYIVKMGIFPPIGMKIQHILNHHLVNIYNITHTYAVKACQLPTYVGRTSPQWRSTIKHMFSKIHSFLLKKYIHYLACPGTAVESRSTKTIKNCKPIPLDRARNN